MADSPTPPPVTLPTLLRAAQRTYSEALRGALAAAGHVDIPANGLFIIGGLARTDGVPIGRLVAALGITKQGAGQLVDGLVERGYLARGTDAADRRQVIVTLTGRGRAAAAILASARERLDAVLAATVGAAAVAITRRTLGALIERGRLDRELAAAGVVDGEPAGDEAEAGAGGAGGGGAIADCHLTGVAFCNCAMGGARFGDVDLGEAVFEDVNMAGVRITNARMTGVAIEDADIRGMTVNGHDIAALIAAAGGGASGPGGGETGDLT